MKRNETTNNTPRYTVAIDEPKVEMVTCVAISCGRRCAKHEAYRVTVEKWEPYTPGGRIWDWNMGGPWQGSMRTWSAAQQTMLTVTASVHMGEWKMPEPTHYITTYVGYGCCEEHAGTGSIELQA